MLCIGSSVLLLYDSSLVSNRIPTVAHNIGFSKCRSIFLNILNLKIRTLQCLHSLEMYSLINSEVFTNMSPLYLEL